MANKDLFKQAIAEAKSVREAAIANAKEALEETLTPQLKDLLAAKLQEMEEKEEEVTEEVVEESSEFTEVQAEAENDSEETEDGKEEEEVEAEEEATEEAEEMEDMDLKDLSVSDFKDLIRDIIAQEMDTEEAETEMGSDMDSGDMEEPADDDLGIEPEAEAEDEEEIDLDELLKELEEFTEAEDVSKDEELTPEVSADINADSPMSEEEDEKKEEALPITASADTLTKIVHSLLDGGKIQPETADDLLNAISNSPSLDVYEEKEADNNLSEALETVETLKAQLSEVNLLNAKLLYVNKVFKANNLTESQKVSIIAAFDKAETVKEVKLVFETVSENVVVKRTSTPIKENKLGMASKATGTTASKKEVISEVSDAVLRMQKLAGII